jgi:hypothetical protein
MKSIPRLYVLLSISILVFLIAGILARQLWHRSLAGSKAQKGSANLPSYQKFRETQRTFIKDSVAVLKDAVAKNDSVRVNEISRILPILGKEVIAELMVLLKERNWNLNTEVLKILSNIHDPEVVQKLVEFYKELKPEEASMKEKVISAIASSGGYSSLPFLLNLYKEGKNEYISKKILSAYQALGGDMKVADKGAKRDNKEDKILVDVKNLNPQKPEDFEKIKQILSQKANIGTKLIALQKLSERQDKDSVDLLITIIKSGEDKIIQTNAIASLARMRTNYARLSLTHLRQFGA